jgi:hypothetical protein
MGMTATLTVMAGQTNGHSCLHVMAAAVPPLVPARNPPSRGTCTPQHLVVCLAMLDNTAHLPQPVHALRGSNTNMHCTSPPVSPLLAHQVAVLLPHCSPAPPTHRSYIHTAGLSTNTGASDTERATQGPNMCRSTVLTAIKWGLTAAPDMAQSAGVGPRGPTMPGSPGLVSCIKRPCCTHPWHTHWLAPAAAACCCSPVDLARGHVTAAAGSS